MTETPEEDATLDVWCQTCQHTHIPDIPAVTYRCRSCGWGQWFPEDAAFHRGGTGHETYRVEHSLIPARPEAVVLEVVTCTCGLVAPLPYDPRCPVHFPKG